MLPFFPVLLISRLIFQHLLFQLVVAVFFALVCSGFGCLFCSACPVDWLSLCTRSIQVYGNSEAAVALLKHSPPDECNGPCSKSGGLFRPAICILASADIHQHPPASASIHQHPPTSTEYRRTPGSGNLADPQIMVLMEFDARNKNLRFIFAIACNGLWRSIRRSSGAAGVPQHGIRHWRGRKPRA